MCPLTERRAACQQAMHLGMPQVLGILLIVVASLQPILRAAKSEPFGAPPPFCPLSPHKPVSDGRAM